MDHDQIKDRLTEFRDGRLPQDQRSEILRHMADCPSCVKELNDLERLAKAFFPRPLPPDPEDTEAFVAAVMAKLPPPALADVSYPAARYWAPAMSVAFAAFMFSLWLPLDEVTDPIAAVQSAQERVPADLISYVSEDR